MKLRIMQKCNCYKEGYECGGFDYLVLRIGAFRIRCFNDNGYKFLYMHLGEKYWRWDW